MKLLRILVLFGLSALPGCAAHRTDGALGATDALLVTRDVEAFLATVSADLTRTGPAAWRSHLAGTPEFFMAVNGRMQFADAAAAAAAVDQLVDQIASLEFALGTPLRIEPLSRTLALVAAPYVERRVDRQGAVVEEDGFLTALVERGDSGWRFRNAHWSLAEERRPAMEGARGGSER